MNKQRKFLAGFTLIEFLVVIFIISLISGSVLVNSWKNQDQYYVSRAAQELAANLRLAQSLALSGEIQGAIIPSGYGFYSQSATEYLVFYNVDASKIYDANSVVLKTLALEKASLAPVGSSIFFTPPNPATFINGVNADSKTFTVTAGSRTKNVTISVGGKIDIE